jgi:hypothetical protein
MPVQLPKFQTIGLLVSRSPVPPPRNLENLLEFFPFRICHVAGFAAHHNSPFDSFELIGTLAGTGGA